MEFKRCLLCRGEVRGSKFSARRKFCSSTCCAKYNRMKRKSLPEDPNRVKKVYSRRAPPIIMG